MAPRISKDFIEEGLSDASLKRERLFLSIAEGSREHFSFFSSFDHLKGEGRLQQIRCSVAGKASMRSNVGACASYSTPSDTPSSN